MLDSANCSIESLVELLHLQPHPEGGWYRELHRSSLEVRRDDGQQRAALTLILFLLGAQEISRWHRVIGADETWHHAGGDPLDLWILPPAGGVAQRLNLGPLGSSPLSDDDPHEPAQPVHVVPAGWWQAARCPGAWTLVSCCVGPGFEFEDFELLSHQPASSHPPGALSDLL